MRQKIFKYLSEYSTEPKLVDSLIITAYLRANSLGVKNNQLVKEYQINQDNKEAQSKVDEFLDILSEEVSNFDFEVLIELFEFVVSPEDRVLNGAVYTPQDIREYIISGCLKKVDADDISELSYADIACGCGGFLYDIARIIKRKTDKTYKQIFWENLFGLDIQEYSINRTKLLLSLLALSEAEDEEYYDFNLFQGDALAFDWYEQSKEFEGFDIIVGNPPYVRLRNLNLDTKELLKNWEVCDTGLTDLYIPFFQIGIENLSENGVLGYITMNSFFKSLNGRALRAYFKKNQSAIQIIDFEAEQIFRSRSTYTCICFISSKPSDYIEYTTSTKSKLSSRHKFVRVNYEDLESQTGWNLKNNKIIADIESVGIPFGKVFKTRHGIATLKNNIYIFRPEKEDERYYYFKNGRTYKIEKNICKDIVNPNKLKNNASFEEVVEKLIFPYDGQQKPQLISEETFKEEFPQAYSYLKGKRSILKMRDKGNGSYQEWYAFGRTQSLERVRNKLFFPKISNKIPSTVFMDDKELYYYNGQAVISNDRDELIIASKIMQSRLFWFYVTQTSKPYNSKYYSLNGGYINNFGIPEFTDDEKDFIIIEENKEVLDEFFESKYEIDLDLF